MTILRQMTRADYTALRAKLRRNTFINSRQVLEMRFAFKSEKFIMGGVVTRKSQAMRGDNQEVLALESASSWEYTDPEMVAMFINVELELYDFSGMFVVQFFRIKRAAAMHQRLGAVKEGDLIYLLGEVIPVNAPEQYIIIAERLFTEDELVLFKRGIRNMRRCLRRIKQGPLPNEDVAHVLCFNTTWNPMAIVWLFIRGDQRLEDEDRIWLADSAYTMYEKNSTPNLAALIRKYYCIYKRCGQDDIAALDETKQDFYSRYPALATF